MWRFIFSFEGSKGEFFWTRWREGMQLWISAGKNVLVVENGVIYFLCRMLLCFAAYRYKSLKYQGFLMKKTKEFYIWGLV